MIQIKKEQMNLIAPLFKEIEDSMVKACLQGYMGDAYVVTVDQPVAALIVSGEYSFFGGEADSREGEHLIKNLFALNPRKSTIGIFSENQIAWEKRLLCFPENNPVAVPRFGMIQKNYFFNHDLLQSFIDKVPKGFKLLPFNEYTYAAAMKQDWAKEFCETFGSVKEYLTKGFGFAMMEDDRMVSGASTMTVYDEGIEVQVATHKAYRRRGLALPCAAALVLECSKRGICPCWDAANNISKKMALKLGYEYKGEYNTIHMSPSFK